MNIQRNDRLIKRNSQIGRIAMFAGLAVLLGGMFISYKYQTQFILSMGALLFGFILSQVGIFYSNRWGRRPRPDELLDQALKGLDYKYTIYHFCGPAPHILLGPSGIWALIPYYQRGTITFQNGRWRQRGGGALYSYLKIFAQEGLGRPELDVSAEIENIQSYLKKSLPSESFPDESQPPVKAALVFTDTRTVIDIPEEIDTPAATVKLKDLKALVRKSEKGKSLPLEKIKLLEDAFLSIK
jgi:hypothetical protein